MKGIAATHLLCGECGALTTLEDGDDPATKGCAPCEEADRDATCVSLVAAIPCPDGVTAEKAAAGALCGSSDHHYGDGRHVVDVD